MPKIPDLLKQTLQDKAVALTEELTSWAQSQRLLPAGKKLVVSIEIVEVPLVEVKVRTQIYDRALTDKEWDAVLSLPWNANSRAKATYDFLRGLRESPEQVVELNTYDVGLHNQWLKSLRAQARLMRVRPGAPRHGVYALLGPRSQ